MGRGHLLDNTAEPIAWNLGKNDLYECVCAGARVPGGTTKSLKTTAVLGLPCLPRGTAGSSPKGFPVGRRLLVCVGNARSWGAKPGWRTVNASPRRASGLPAPGDGVGRRVHRGAHQCVPRSRRPGCRSPAGGARGPPRADWPQLGVVSGPGVLLHRRGDLASRAGGSEADQ